MLFPSPAPSHVSIKMARTISGAKMAALLANFINFRLAGADCRFFTTAQVRQFHQGRYIFLKLSGAFDQEEDEEKLPMRPPTPPSDGEAEED